MGSLVGRRYYWNLAVADIADEVEVRAYSFTSAKLPGRTYFLVVSLHNSLPHIMK